MLPWALYMLVRHREHMQKRTTANGKPAHKGILLGSFIAFLSVSASAVTFPFAQARRDALGCDALCQGAQTSLRSGLTLIGAALIGRASDRLGRIPMLWIGAAASLVSFAINASRDTLDGMWWAIVPVALLNHNFAVCKALFSDYIDEMGGSDADKAGAVGKLGMAVGLSFMAGPMLASVLVSSYQQAVRVAAAVTVLSASLIMLLPAPAERNVGEAKSSATQNLQKTGRSALMGFLTLPVLRTRGAQVLMVLRLFMALAFHMFVPVWQVSIKERFNFGPRDHAQFMGLVGLTYALSQGLVAKPLVHRTAERPNLLVLGCIFILGAARPFALWTSSLRLIYMLYVLMVIALGVLNTAITTASSKLADKAQLGGFFGVMESVENVAGMIGPALGGLLAQAGQHATLGAVVGCYAAAFALVSLFFTPHVSNPSRL